MQVTKVNNPNEGRSWFLPVILLVTLIGGGAIVALASSRTSNTGVAPTIGDHWHTAYGVYVCDTFTSPIQDQSGSNGLHTHGGGYIHVHPAATTATGNNANLGNFLANSGASISDDSYVPGASEQPITLSEENGCGDEDAVLQLAYWEDQFSDDAPEIVTEDLASFKFDEDGGALTIALVPLGAEIPKPPTAAAAYG